MAANCIVNGCGKESATRGLCPNCYQGARQEILSKNHTWEGLAALGLAAAKRKKQSKFAIALLEVTTPE